MSEQKRLKLQAGYIDEAPEVAAALGLFVARWSLAEMCLIMPLTVATGASQEVCATMLASTNSAEGKIKLVRGAVSHTDRVADTKKQELDRILRDFLTACPTRNDMMHHLWGRRTDGLVFTVDYRKKDSSGERLRGRTVDTIFDACNTALSIAHRLCRETGSSWVDDDAVRVLTLTTS